MGLGFPSSWWPWPAILRTPGQVSTAPSRLWLRAFLISIAVWVVFAFIGFVTAGGAGEFDIELLVFSFLLDAGWAAVGAILGVVIARTRRVRESPANFRNGWESRHSSSCRMGVNWTAASHTFWS